MPRGLLYPRNQFESLCAASGNSRARGRVRRLVTGRTPESDPCSIFHDHVHTSAKSLVLIFFRREFKTPSPLHQQTEFGSLSRTSVRDAALLPNVAVPPTPERLLLSSSHNRHLLPSWAFFAPAQNHIRFQL